MINYLETLLKKKTENSENNVLYTQWMFDKKLIPQAMRAIHSFFPHYSLHDESHSNAVLSNIVRVLGTEAIESFSSIDIWLLLEAAYYHDLGMIVTAEDIIENLTSCSFVNHLNGINNDPSNSLYKYASYFSANNGVVEIKTKTLTLDVLDGFKFLIADYFRPQHADRSGYIVKDPNSKISMSSPRVIIPKRIFLMLSEICNHHTQDFEVILSMPRVEAGLNNENAHPQLIACLLRLGDLLDLDNNRFSEVLLRTLSSLPLDTEYHYAKHMSIEHFRVDQSIIEITAKCHYYEISEISQQWFDCLNKEYINLLLNWGEILPEYLNIKLPTMGHLTVILDGGYKYINGKSKPSFKVDSLKALEILRGVGLYKEPYQCIREVIQNAIDSTLIKIWLTCDNQELMEPSKGSDKLFYDYPISVSIVSKECPFETQQTEWTITITDNGIGISTNDLKFIETAGSSSLNKSRNEIIDSMPEWIKPSGMFGIGLQSIFGITDAVSIKTKSILSDEILEIQLNSPSATSKGALLIKELASNPRNKSGAELSFSLTVDKLPNSVTMHLDDTITTRSIRSFDPTEQHSLDYAIHKIIDELVKANQYSYIPIKLMINNERIVITNELALMGEHFFDKDSGFQIMFNNRGRSSTYYRGQYVSSDFQLEYLAPNINILSGKASDVLTYNRNEVNPKFQSTLKRHSIQAIINALYSDFDRYLINPVDKILGSMFISHYWAWNKNTQLDKDRYAQYWKDCELSSDPKATIDSVLNSKEVYIKYMKTKERNKFHVTLSEGCACIEISESNRTMLPNYIDFTFYKLYDHFTAIEKLPISDDSCVEQYRVSNDNDTDPIGFNDLVNMLKSQRTSWGFGARTVVPCMNNYSNLRLRQDIDIPLHRIGPLTNGIYIDYPLMLSPYAVSERDNSHGFELKLKLSDNFYEYVYTNRYDHNVTKEDIISTYRNLIDATQDKVLSR